MNDVVINWFASYLDDRSQYVRCSKSISTTSKLLFGVLQDSVLGPILVDLYTADLLQLMKCHQLLSQFYADDTQIYGFCSPSEVNTLYDHFNLFLLSPIG